jgi:hypothetical protein
MPQPTNKLAPQVTGVNRLVDFVVQRLPAEKFPTSARTLIETAQGKREPITETHFTPEELQTIRQLIALKGGDAGSIQYPDYNTLAKEMRAKKIYPASIAPSFLSGADPFGNIQTTLGRFNYARDANGNLVVQDTYDFNPPDESYGAEELGFFQASPYGVARIYAGEKIPPGMGRQVKINLGR